MQWTDKDQTEAASVARKYTDRIVVVVHTDLLLARHKYVVNRDMTGAYFIAVLRRRVALHDSQAVFLLFCDTRTIVDLSSSMSTYVSHTDVDNVLHLYMVQETCFG